MWRKTDRPHLFLSLVAFLTVASAAISSHAGSTLDNIRLRGEVRCGVNTSLAGFSAKNALGNWAGMDVDICRAIAAAVLGSGEKVNYLPMTGSQRFVALKNDDIDILLRNTTFTLARDASLGLRQTVVTYYDGQGFLVPLKSKVGRATQLKGKTVCVQAGTTSEKNLADFSRNQGLNIRALTFDRQEGATGAYFAGQCAAFTDDASALASARSTNALDQNEHQILPEQISKEPLGAMVRRGDEEWFNAVSWVLYGLIEAEEVGITKANIDHLKANSGASKAGRWLARANASGPQIGLSREWAYRALRTSGNYGEIFERNLGGKSPLRLPRGLNNLWSEGGMHYPIPFF